MSTISELHHVIGIENALPIGKRDVFICMLSAVL